MLIPMDQRRRLGAARWIGAAATLALLAFPGGARAQEAAGTVRGRVVTAAGDPAPGISVEAQSADLTLSRRTTTDDAGFYILPLLPPGNYVISFEHDDMVTVRRVTRVATMETVIADASMPEGPPSSDVISISLDGERFPRSPGVADVWRRIVLDQLPVDGGLYSAATLASGTQPDRDRGSFVSIDGAPVRFGPPAGDRLLLDPGPMAVQQVSVMSSAIHTGTSRFSNGAISAVTKSGSDRLSGSANVSFSSADRLADHVYRASGTRSVGSILEFGLGVPIDGRRSWLFAAGVQRRDPLDVRARLSDLTTETLASTGVWELKATHAVSDRHRLQALLMQGARAWELAPPSAAVSAETKSSLSGRDATQRLLSAGYTGEAGAWYFTARATHERWNESSAADIGTIGPAVRDLSSGSVAGGSGACADCLLDERTNTTWRLTAERPFTFGDTLHHVTVGVEAGGGDVEGPDAGAPGVDVVAGRFLTDGAGVFPVLNGGGASWVVFRKPMPTLAHSARSVFVSDDWRPTSSITVHAGMRWDRQRLEVAGGDRVIAERSAWGPRVSAAWRSPRTLGWTLYGGLARYEDDVIDLVGDRLEPAGDWFAYDGPAINVFGPAVDAVTAASAALAWLQNAGGIATYSGADVPLAAIRDRIRAGLAPTLEWTAGGSRRIGDEIFVRADLTWQRRRPLDLDGVVPSFSFAPRLYERPDAIEPGRVATRYAALALQVDYDLGVQADVGARYTLSRLHGVADEQTTLPAGVAPTGDLAGDKRHRLHFWGYVALLEGEEHGTVAVTALQTISSGEAYAAASWIDAGPGAGVASGPAFAPYYFTNPGQLRGDTARRTDLMASYVRVLPGTIKTEIAVRFDILNLFGNDIVPNPQDYAVARTALTTSGQLATFSPYTDAPISGVHWDFDPRLAARAAAAPETLARAYRLTVGIRF